MQPQQQRQRYEKKPYEKKHYSRPYFDWSGTFFKPNPKPRTSFEEMMATFLESSNEKNRSVQWFFGQREVKKAIKSTRRQLVANSSNNNLGG